MMDKVYYGKIILWYIWYGMVYCTSLIRQPGCPKQTQNVVRTIVDRKSPLLTMVRTYLITGIDTGAFISFVVT